MVDREMTKTQHNSTQSPCADEDILLEQSLREFEDDALRLESVSLAHFRKIHSQGLVKLPCYAFGFNGGKYDSICSEMGLVHWNTGHCEVDVVDANEDPRGGIEWQSKLYVSRLCQKRDISIAFFIPNQKLFTIQPQDIRNGKILLRATAYEMEELIVQVNKEDLAEKNIDVHLVTGLYDNVA